MYCQTHLLHDRPTSRYTREYGRTSSWYNRSGNHPQNKTRGTVALGGASGAPAEILLNTREGTISGMWVSRTTPVKDNEGEAIEGRDKSQGCDGTEDVEGVAQAPKESDSAPADATDVENNTIKSVGTAATPQQPKAKSKRNIQEKCRGQHQSL